MSDLVLGIDVGTSAVRVAAIDQAGRVAAFAASAMPAPLRDGTRITQDPAVWARGLDDAMARLAYVRHACRSRRVGTPRRCGKSLQRSGR